MNDHGGRPFVRSAVTLAAGAALLLGAIHLVYRDKALPGVYVGPVSVAGKTRADIADEVRRRSEPLKQLVFRYDDREFSVAGETVGLAVDAEATADAALRAGRQGGLDTVLTPSRLGFTTADVRLRYRLDQESLRRILDEQTAELGTPVREATVALTDGTFEIVPERPGRDLNLDQAVRDARYRIERFDNQVGLREETIPPEVRARELLPAKAYATFLAARPVTVRAGSETFSIPADRLATWVTFRRVDADSESPLLKGVTVVRPFAAALNVAPRELGLPSVANPTLRAEIDPTKVGTYVPEVAGQVDRPPVNARLGFTDGRVVISGEARDGQVVDPEAAVARIAAAMAAPDRTAELPIITKPADIRPDTLATLGITTLIGRSTTTFGGSPANRIFNIGVGAARFNGVVIKPGDEFSFNQVLGDVGPETGYRPELVIKENKTVPEYGGGLCQVSTTMFRAALDAGLPITARTNHSYAVHYYAPIGMDATIYPPNPDMRFRNNTPGHILVQTIHQGTSLTYEFYGTADGRTSDTQIIHIAASEEGGGTASFRYTVTGGPEPIDRVFYSSYKPRSSFPVAGERSLN